MKPATTTNSGRPRRLLAAIRRKPWFAIKSGGTASWVIRLLVAAAVVYVVVWVPTRGSGSLIDTCTLALGLMAAAMSLNLLLGYTGQISLGHSAFFGIGVYTTGIFVTRWGWSPLQTMPVAFVVAFVVGALVSLPALRIKGVYLALVTLALGLVFPQMMKWKKLAWLTGGTNGLDQTGYKFDKDNRTYEIFGWNPWGNLRGENSKPFYFWVGVGIVVVVYLICRGIVKSRMGRALVAIRDNSTAASVMGINLALTKGVVFGLSAAMCALPGCLSTMASGTVTADTEMITVAASITFLVIMVVGGAGSLWGPIIGAAVFKFVEEKTGGWTEAEKIPGVIRPLLSWSDVAPGQGIFAIALIGLMFLAPTGIVGLWKQTIARFVAVVPKPAGTGTLAAMDSVATDS
ncbi:MAG: branched-chain amino acid ABC transporter permease [Actinomycetota bacterium]|nr:branched-chain amino acid ABC transporter permease [Actinomycetota bacterium]